MLAAQMFKLEEGTIIYPYNDETGRERDKIVVFKRPGWGWTVAGGTDH